MRLFTPSRKVIISVILINVVFFSSLIGYLGYEAYFDGIGPQIEANYPVVQTSDQTIYWISGNAAGSVHGISTHTLSLESLNPDDKLNTIELISTSIDDWIVNRILFDEGAKIFAVQNNVWVFFNIQLVNQSKADENDGVHHISSLPALPVSFLLKADMSSGKFSYAIMEPPTNYTIRDAAIDPTGTNIGFVLETADSYYKYIGAEFGSLNNDSFVVQSLRLDSINMQSFTQFPLIDQNDISIRFDTTTHDVENSQRINAEFGSFFSNSQKLDQSNNIQIPNEFCVALIQLQINVNGDLYVQYSADLGSDFVNNATAYNFVYIENATRSMYRWLLYGNPNLFIVGNNIVYVSNYYFPFRGNQTTYTMYIGVFDPVSPTEDNYPTTDTIYPHANMLIPINEVNRDLAYQISNQIQISPNNGDAVVLIAFSGYLDNTTILPELEKDGYTTPVEQSSVFLYSVTLSQLLQAQNNTYVGSIHLIRGTNIDGNYQKDQDRVENYRENGIVRTLLLRVSNGKLSFLFCIDTTVVIPHIKHVEYRSALFKYDNLGKDLIR